MGRRPVIDMSRVSGGILVRDGPRGVIHGNTGRRPANVIDMELRQKIMALSRTEYALIIETHFTGKLATLEGEVSASVRIPPPFFYPLLHFLSLLTLAR